MAKKTKIFIIIIIALSLIWYLASYSGTPVEPIPENTSVESTTTPLKIQYRIKVQTEIGEFNDALYFTKEEWSKLTQEELAAMVKKRVDNWVNIIKHPAPVAEPTKEELQAQAEQMQMQIEDMQRQLDDVNAKINAK